MNAVSIDSRTVPNWLFGAFVAATLTALGYLAALAVDVRDAVRDHELRISILEKASPSMLAVGQQLGTFGAQMQTLSKSVDDMREDIRGLRRAPSPPR